MMKTKKIRKLVLVLFFLFPVLVGCRSRIEIITTDFFVFELNHKEKHATAIALTELGKEQGILVIPTMVEDYPVKYIGKPPKLPLLGEVMGALLIGYNIKKIYLPFSLDDRAWLGGIEGMDVILGKAHPESRLIDSINRFSEAQLYYLDDLTKLNTFFMFNFDSSENEGYYWVDYINASNLYIIPTDPVREGFTFDGWYYEEECTTSWDNQVPTSENEKLTLYAKWI